MRRSRDSVT